MIDLGIPVNITPAEITKKLLPYNNFVKKQNMKLSRNKSKKGSIKESRNKRR